MEPSSSAEMLAVLGSIKESFFPRAAQVGHRPSRPVRRVARGVVAPRARAPSGRAFFQADFRGNDLGHLATGLGRQGTRAHRLEQHLLARLAGRDHGGERSRRSPGFDHLSGRSSTLPTQGHRSGRSLIRRCRRRSPRQQCGNEHGLSLAAASGAAVGPPCPGGYHRRGHSRGDQATRRGCVAADEHLLDRTRRTPRWRGLCILGWVPAALSPTFSPCTTSTSPTTWVNAFASATTTGASCGRPPPPFLSSTPRASWVSLASSSSRNAAFRISKGESGES